MKSYHLEVTNEFEKAFDLSEEATEDLYWQSSNLIQTKASLYTISEITLITYMDVGNKQ